MMSFDRLEAGKTGYDLAIAVYRATENFPKREWYGLASQCRRAALSVPLNLAEGYAKRGIREFRRFVDIALGFLAELFIALRLCRDLEFLSGEELKRLMMIAEKASKCT